MVTIAFLESGFGGEGSLQLLKKRLGEILWGPPVTEDRVSLCQRRKTIAISAEWPSLWPTSRSRKAKTEWAGKRFCMGGGKEVEAILSSRGSLFLDRVRFDMVYESLCARKHMITYSTSDLGRR
uniref:Uncharacterized protein n=1 Tax=Populus trichocarpa TaxID=3694 RepID=A0A2K1YQ79_POPTR